MKNKEKVFQILITVTTFVMVILRFLLNEKGRTNPDSIRYFRTADAFPVIDNTVTPLGYPLSIKLVALISDEFWASKIIGLLTYLFILYFAYKKKFYFKEFIVTGALFSYVSIFSYSMSENLILPVVFVFLYIAQQIIEKKIGGTKAIILLGAALILMYNIRYSAIFIIGGTFLFGLLSIKKSYSKIFLISSFLGFAFIVLYQLLFINYFNENFIDQSLDIGLKPSAQLLTELVQGLLTSFNPFIHIANPSGGLINYAIYAIGAINISIMLLLFIKNKLSESEQFLIFIGLTGIFGSFFIQYFYSVNPIDYRLLSMFILGIWLVYFKKLFQIFGLFTYGIAGLSLLSGFAFTWLSRGNYLENRKEITTYLKNEKLDGIKLKFYLKDEQELDKIQVAELISTVNPKVSITFKARDTLERETLTEYKVLSKIKIKKNKFQ